MTLLLEKEINKLKKMLLTLSAIVEDNLFNGVKSLVDRDLDLARKVIEDDTRVDEAEVELEEEGLKILALHQPMAIDLRFIVAVLRINSDLERIADFAVNLAERATTLCEHETDKMPIKTPELLESMARASKAMLRKSLDALVNMDAGLAREVIAGDDEVDEMSRKMFTWFYEMVRLHPERVECLTQLLSASRYLERVADHATNIAEDVAYMVEGEIIRHHTDELEVPRTKRIKKARPETRK
jgi:phosphate transport system protein